MAAVMSPTDPLDALRRPMSLDDNEINYSGPSDWREKYNEVADMLAETRAELDDFHHASKELEAELENELQRTEKAQQELRVKVAKAETERDDWKSKFMSLQTTHNTTTTSLQRELDQLRHEHQQVKVQMRELEMGNDDLERNERAVSSSLADVEAKYSRALEEKILLEHELLDKASLEEECQRLKDELRDANVEISIMKDQLSSASNHSATSLPDPSTTNITLPSEDNLLKTPPPADLSLSELSPSSEDLPSLNTTPKALTKTVVRRAGLQTPPKTRIASPSSSTSGLSRATSRIPASPARSHVTRNPSTVSTSSTSSSTSVATSKSKGVQMVSEMRARVKTLEQKIHTRVPRLRMGSVTGKTNGSFATSTYAGPGVGSITRTTTAAMGRDSLSSRQSSDSKRSSDSEKSKKDGWVLIMEDSPSPQKVKARERRRASSPLGEPIPFRPSASTAVPPSRVSNSPTLTYGKPNPLAKSTMDSGLRRPGSRLSGTSLSSATTSSIPTPSSRPATPTFLPVPNGTSGLKRSTGSLTASSMQAKRSSLGASTNFKSSRPGSNTPSSTSSRHSLENGKTLPALPAGLHENITIRASRVPKSGTTSALSKSRIGRPGSIGTRRSSDADLGPPVPQSRPRSSSSATQSTEYDETEMF